MRRALIIAIVGFVFGVASAYLSVQIFNKMHVDSDHPKDHWYDPFIFTLAPGNILQSAAEGQKFQGFASTYEDVILPYEMHDAMFFDGIAWMLIALVLSYSFLGIKFLLLQPFSVHAR